MSWNYKQFKQLIIIIKEYIFSLLVHVSFVDRVDLFMILKWIWTSDIVFVNFGIK